MAETHEKASKKSRSTDGNITALTVIRSCVEDKEQSARIWKKPLDELEFEKKILLRAMLNSFSESFSTLPLHYLRPERLSKWNCSQPEIGLFEVLLV